MNRGIVAVCFGVSAVAVAVSAGTITPVAYGIGEQTTGVTATGIIGILTALLSSAGGLWALFKKDSTIKDFAGNALKHLTDKSGTDIALDAAFLTIAAAVFAKKRELDPTLLTALAELRKKIDAAEVKP